MTEIYCGNCGQKLSGDDKICPSCGSRHRVLAIREKITAHEQIKGKVKKKGIRKPVREFKSGDDLHRKSRKWYHREILIDREKNYYREIIKDKDTGEIIHICEEPLSEHIGHGSAKYRKSKKRSELQSSE